MTNDRRLATTALPLGAGVLIAALVTVMLSELPFRWALSVLGGALLLLPALMVKDRRAYGLTIFLLVVLMQGYLGKNLTNNLYDGEEILQTLGIPPAKTVGIVLRPSDFVLFWMVGVWALQLVTRRASLWIPRSTYLAVGFLVWAGISAARKAPFPYLSVFEFSQQIKYLLLFVYIANVVQSRRLVKLLIAVLLAFLFIEATFTLGGWQSETVRRVLALTDYRGAEAEELPSAFEQMAGSAVGRALGTFHDYAVTAVYLHFLLPLALTRVFIPGDRTRRLAALLLLVLGMAAMWVTYSRTGLIAALVALSCCVYLCHRRGYISHRQFMALVYAGLLFLLMLSPALKEFLESRPANVQNRFPILEETRELISKNPVFGVGLNNSTAVRKEYLIRSLGEELEGIGTQPIHNHYLVVLSETGFIGFVLFMGFFFLIVKQAARLMKGPDVDIASFCLAILCTFIAVGVQLLSDTIGGHAILTMLYFFAGLTCAIGRLPTAAADRRVPPSWLGVSGALPHPQA